MHPLSLQMGPLFLHFHFDMLSGIPTVYPQFLFAQIPGEKDVRKGRPSYMTLVFCLRMCNGPKLGGSSQLASGE